MSETVISAAVVKQLRDQTGVGMMDCKKALEESNGDFELAVEYLRKKGQKVSAKRADREAKEGVVIAMVSEDHTKGIVVKLSSETDFVAKNEDFIDLTRRIAAHALNTFYDDKETLLNSSFEGITLNDKILERVAAIGEKIELANYERIEAPMVVSYIHMGNKAGVILGMSKAGDQILEAGKNVAMQVAAMHPIAVDESSVDASIVAKEIEIGKEQARAEGKPEEMLEKIAIGKLNKFYKESTLINQAYVKDSKISVQQYLSSVDKELKITGFRHVKLG